MTSEEIRKILKSYRDCKRIVLSKQELLEEAKKNRDMLSAVNYERVVVKSSLKESIVEKSANRILKVEEDFLKACEKLFEIEDSIRDMLAKLNEVEQGFVIDRYMKDLKPVRVASKYHFTIEATYNKYSKIFKKLKNLKVIRSG